MNMDKPSLGAKVEAQVAIVNSLLDVVHDTDVFYHLTARDELRARKHIIKMVTKNAHEMNAEHGLYLAEQYAQEQFERRKEEGETHANR